LVRAALVPPSRYAEGAAATSLIRHHGWLLAFFCTGFNIPAEELAQDVTSHRQYLVGYEKNAGSDAKMFSKPFREREL